jgi:hypothetical protein
MVLVVRCRERILMSVCIVDCVVAVVVAVAAAAAAAVAVVELDAKESYWKYH